MPPASTRATTPVLAVLGAASLGIAATGAYAAWSVSGSAPVSASTASVQGLQVTAGALSGLYPGGSVNVVLSVTNPNAFPVTVTAVAFASPTAVGSCAGSHLVLSDRTGLTAAVTAGGTSSITLTGAATLSTSAPDACQGVTFPSVTATVTGASTG